MGAIHKNVSKTVNRSFVFLVFPPCQRPVVRTQRSWAWTRQPPSCSTSCSRPEREVSAASVHAGHTSGWRFGWSQNFKKERKKYTPCIICLKQSSILLSILLLICMFIATSFWSGAVPRVGGTAFVEGQHELNLFAFISSGFRVTHLCIKSVMWCWCNSNWQL